MRVLIAGRREDGAVAVLVAILAVVLLGIVAFTTDFGMAYAQRRALSTGVDSAALGVVQAKYASAMANRSATCADLVTADTALAAGAPTKASNIAWAQVKANSPFEADIPASDVTTTLNCVGVGILQVTVVVTRTMNPIFGGVLGAGSSQMKLNRQAVAALGVSNEVGNLVPIALCESQADAIKNSVGVGEPPVYPIQKVPLSKVWGGSSLCGTADGAGNWGWLKFDGQGNGESDLGDMLKNHNGRLKLSGVPPHYEIAGVPGNKANGNPVQEALAFLNGTPVTIPVYRDGTISGNGQNATYTIVGFLSVTICGYDSGPKLVKNDCYDTTPALRLEDDEMQVQYINYIEAGEMAETCALGGTCSFLPYATRLVG